MKICGLQKVSFVDYPEHICATLFTSGCNFACPFCHNAGLVNNTETAIPENEIFDYLESRKHLLNSVCISGGEPTLQPDLPEFIKKIKDMGFLVKLDTNGSNINMLRRLVEHKLIDYIAMDVKNSLNKYNFTIGKPAEFKVREVVDYIMNCGVSYEFRTTLVNGFHSEQDIIAISEMLKGANNYYLQKFVDSGNCIQNGLTHIEKSIAENFQALAQKNIPNTHLRGY